MNFTFFGSKNNSHSFEQFVFFNSPSIETSWKFVLFLIMMTFGKYLIDGKINFVFLFQKLKTRLNFTSSWNSKRLVVEWWKKNQGNLVETHINVFLPRQHIQLHHFSQNSSYCLAYWRILKTRLQTFLSFNFKSFLFSWFDLYDLNWKNHLDWKECSQGRQSILTIVCWQEITRKKGLAYWKNLGRWCW